MAVSLFLFKNLDVETSPACDVRLIPVSLTVTFLLAFFPFDANFYSIVQF